jgi:hypothetical protein
MRKASDFATLDLPAVTLAEVHRFDDAVTIHDPVAFVAELEEFMRDKIASAGRDGAASPVMKTLRDKATALKSTGASWEPSATELQRGRAIILREFAQPQNLPLAEFAKLANKSRQQIYKDIAAKRLLALSVGARGQRLPDWQLDPARQQLTQAVLAQAGHVDAWTVFHTLSEPMEALQDRSPVGAVRQRNLPDILRAVFNALGIRSPKVTLEHA